MIKLRCEKCGEDLYKEYTRLSDMEKPPYYGVTRHYDTWVEVEFWSWYCDVTCPKCGTINTVDDASA